MGAQIVDEGQQILARQARARWAEQELQMARERERARQELGNQASQLIPTIQPPFYDPTVLVEGALGAVDEGED